MDRLKLLVREPALLLQLVENIIAALVIINIHVSRDSEVWIMAAIVAVNGILKGLTTHPFPVHFITDLARAVLMIGISFGLNLSVDKVTVLVTLVGTIVALVGSLRTTPAYDPVTRPGGAGGGPVSTKAEGGYANYGFLGIVLIVIGLLIWLLAGMSVIGIILIVLGVVLLLAPLGPWA